MTAALDPREMHEAGRERSMLADLHDPLRYERWLGRFLWLGLLAVLLYISWS